MASLNSPTNRRPPGTRNHLTPDGAGFALEIHVLGSVTPTSNSISVNSSNPRLAMIVPSFFFLS